MAGTALEKVRCTLNQDPLLASAGVTVSIGAINRAPADGDLREMMRAADEVLYRVKSTTKNRVQMEAARIG
jgi:PleD family two-component response regulator